MAISKKSSGPIELQKLERKVFKAYVIGESPLIVHAWSKKALIEILAKQMGQKIPRFPRHPVQDFMDSMYRMDNGNFGFPATALKRVMVDACTSMSKELTKVAARQALFVPAGHGTAISAFSGQPVPIQLIEIHSPVAPGMREDSVRLNGRTADLRYRAEFWPWAMRFTVIYNAKVVSMTTVANLLDTAGFACGLGEWRQERGGVNGQFRLATPAEQKQIDKWAEKGSIQPKITAEAETEFLERLQDDLKKYGEAAFVEEEESVKRETNRGEQRQ
jgi:hypothetical protein